MKKSLSIFNLLSVVLVIVVNYISQIVEFNGVTIGEMSRRYDNLFTPAGYAFSIWGIIFLLLLAYGVYQVRKAFSTKDTSNFIQQTGPWFILANLLNCTWVIVFAYDFTGLSVLVMLGILFSLIKIILNTDMERWDAPIGTIAFVWWPICIYSGWIAVATIANISAYLIKIGWEGGPLSEITWTFIMISVATLVNLLMVYKRNMREFALVGIWALVAIFMRHQTDYISIAYTALGCSVVLLIATAIHGYRNRETNPFQKLRGEL
ncbi:tryptophan-rich sensory protein [Aggregatimonas sangjinii]|uniref:Tryptophan-rich sensory protein n=1 Tax=Aggregatimonas sangjinii TaxID=2583587 RepID=A0A5B7SS14_9FLAO|nr:tryptophan-rich sensory protein [Aggregatimonas sangjinii]QCX01426.1 tryptophan-rich sensory protein [Aggregatimonas sangjinii]